mmetsp:Transcript_17005/g.25735  ORF Transcript_17005/g.25735 Transcript_17005/m.25735 type:complete len:127 (-) Transcript_17005:106-486(-)
MKICLFSMLITSVSAFQAQKNRPVLSSTAMGAGFFDFKPMHGSGSGSSDEELEEQFKTQQAILKERRAHVNFDSLHKKYSKEKQALDVFSLGYKHEDDKYQKTYIDDTDDDTDTKGHFQFPWGLKP